jgi:glucosamine kinase
LFPYALLVREKLRKSGALVSRVSNDIMRTMASGLIYCVDGGGTKSRARLVDAAGMSLAESEGGPCNPGTGFDRAVATFNTLWRQCAAAARLDHEKFDGIVLSIGAAGFYVPAVRSRFLAAIPQFAKTVASSDGYAALIGAGGGKPCGLINVGTGVAGHRLWPSGVSVQRDAWGWIGGDRGSGAWLGRKALRHTLSVIDGIRPLDGLSERVLASAGGSMRLTETLPEMTPDRLAALAPFVLAAADEGVPHAVEIRRRAIEHLTDLARVLDIGDGDTLYAVGGLADVFAPCVGERLGHAFAPPAADAMHGCYLVAAGRAPVERVTGEVVP